MEGAKPCPFCNDENNTKLELIEQRPHSEIWKVICYRRDCHGPLGNTAEEAMLLWNNRGGQ